ncbi:unnamed protein product [Cladocopium goreaui]|uniref:TFIIS-type domain-containing protein n=1 Tax=Cladocopium goreaui TaxID=2562237 RepID=A0A9P1G2U7_9DINO|nr:unnamed protein product [Cladocopium goreaui]
MSLGGACTQSTRPENLEESALDSQWQEMEQKHYSLMNMKLGKAAAKKSNRDNKGIGNYEEQGLKVQPQEAAGVELPWDDARQLVEAIVLSRVDTPDDAVKVLGQSWVPTWDGWKELRQCATERCCVAIAERLCDIAQQNAPYQSKTDTQALQALASEGFMWRKALSHGVNNCLIDSLMLCLSYEHILPNNLTTDVTARRRVAAACRKHLIQEIGDEVAPGSNGLFPFLDAHRDGPRIVDFLFHWFRVVARTNMLIHVHDRFGEQAAGADWNKIAVNLGHRYPQQTVLQLHIYNHTSVRGRGYHFDSLLPITGREAESKKKRSRTVAATNAMKIEAESVLTGAELNDLQREPQRNGGTPEKPSCNKEAAEQQADQRAEAVFAKMAWYFHGTTFATSWLDALLANLIFHGYMLQFPDLLARQDARFHLCRTCQASLEPEQLESDKAFDLQHHLAKAILFFTSRSRDEVNAEVHVYDSTTTDLSVPHEVYTIGRLDSLLVPVFRLYRYKNGRYAALLPANPAERPVFTSGDLHKAAQGSKQNDMNATCTVAPSTNSFGTSGCAAGIGNAARCKCKPTAQNRDECASSPCAPQSTAGRINNSTTIRNWFAARFKLMVGFFQPAQLPTLTAEDMASEQKNDERRKQRKYAMEALDQGWALKNGQQPTTGMFTCGKCKGNKTTYFQMQTRSSDEPMTTFVTCLTCSNRWKFC